MGHPGAVSEARPLGSSPGQPRDTQQLAVLWLLLPYSLTASRRSSGHETKPTWGDPTQSYALLPPPSSDVVGGCVSGSAKACLSACPPAGRSAGEQPGPGALPNGSCFLALHPNTPPAVRAQGRKLRSRAGEPNKPHLVPPVISSWFCGPMNHRGGRTARPPDRPRSSKMRLKINKNRR